VFHCIYTGFMFVQDSFYIMVLDSELSFLQIHQYSETNVLRSPLLPPKYGLSRQLMSQNKFKVYLIQHCVIKFVSDLRQVCGFHRVRRFPPSIKLTATI
jgi:hypothetical protein